MSSIHEIAMARAGDGASHGHVVQLYETEDFLCDVVADYLAQGVERGEPLVVIASAPRRDAIVKRLERKTDVEALRRDERLVLLDAREMLDLLLLDGAPVWERFQRVIVQRLEALAQRHRGATLRAYGEMVDLLWREGKTAAAIQLEEMWNILHARRGLSLLCAYVVGDALRKPDLAAVAAAHDRVLPPEGEQAMREALRSALVAGARTAETEQQLERITDTVPALIAYVDRDLTYRFANAAYGEWLTQSRDEIVGKRVSDVLGEAAYAVVRDSIELALAGHATSLRATIPFRHATRVVDAMYTPDRGPDGSVRGIVALVTDVSEHARHDAVREAARRRAENLLEITAAIAQAVSTDHVLDAVVARVADALSAESTAFWLCDAGTGMPRRVRERGVVPDGLDAVATSAIRTGTTKWPGTGGRIACVPIGAPSGTIGAIALTFGSATQLDDERHAYLAVVAGYCGQALERVRLFEAERASRVATEQLHRLAARLIAAREVGDVYEAALDSIAAALGTPRAAVLVFDGANVMRFVASRGLSEPYRKAVEGHSPWAASERDPEPVLVSDVRVAAELAGYMPLFETERIAALGFFPLVDAGRLVGKFMVYYETPRELGRHERAMASAIANHVATGVSRFSAIERERANARQLRRAASRLTELQEATSRLTSALTIGDVADVVLSVAETMVGAVAGVVYLAKDGELRLAGYRGVPAAEERWRTVAIDAPVVLAEAARARQPIWIDTFADLVARYPYIASAPTSVEHMQAVAVLPLVHAGELLGGFALSFSESDRLDPATRQWLLSFAAQVALAVERARAYEAEQRSRAEAETLYRIADTLSSTQLDVETAARGECDALRGALQRCCELLVQTRDVALARIWTVDANGALEMQASATGRVAFPVEEAELELGDLAKDIAMRRRPHRLPDLAVYPLVVEDKLVGVMALRAPAPLVTDTLEVLASSAHTIAIGIERLRAHADRERLVAELATTVRFNETFAGMLGHDLRNPLGSMITGTQLVMLRTTDEKITGPLQRVLSSGERMTRMIDQLLDFTRARVGGGLALQPRATNLTTLVEAATGEVALVHPGSRFEVAVAGDPCGAWDSDRLAQVFSNLVGNAVQHGVAQSPIRIAIDGGDPAHAVVEIWNAGAVPPELVPILFEPFRGAQHRRSGTKGLGLGLFITQQIIRAHGGDIAVSSAIDRGTTFRIHLPRKGP